LTVLDTSQTQQFEAQGFLVVRGLLDPKAELAALDVAYQDLIETLALIHFAEAGAEPPRAFRERALGERFALLQGASGGHAVEHLDPQLNAFNDAHRRRSDLPSAQIPQLFRLLRSGPLLDAVEALVGPEIAVSPNYHLNFKLAAPQLALARETASRLGLPDPSQRPYHAFHLAQTPWHRDATYALPDSHDSRIVAAWIPMTQAGGERGSLSVIPGSHRDRRAPTASQRELRERGVEVAASPGDVVFFDNWLLHGSTPNQSAADVRWAFNFRYLPHGQAAGRPYLPTFLLRSRSQPQRELHNPLLWSAIWGRALDHLAQPASPVPQLTSLERARAITRDWQRRMPDEAAWLMLAPAVVPAWRLALRRARRRLKRALRHPGRLA
jgi:phytanoyl-CoA hydroxylase